MHETLLSRRHFVGGSAAFALAPLSSHLTVEAATAAVAERDIQTRTADAAANLLFAENGVYGVVLMRTDGTVLYKQNADLPFVAASLYKLIVMVDFYAARDGEIDFAEPVLLSPDYFHAPDEEQDVYYNDTWIGVEVSLGELVETMVTYSSNVAAHALLDRTSAGDLNAVAADLGMTNTAMLMPLSEISPWPPKLWSAESPGESETALRFVNAYGKEGLVNLTTPADIATFFLMLTEGRIISPDTSQEMIDLLGRQEINDRLPFLLPIGTECAHKTGDLDGVVHDAGIVYGDLGPIIVAALSEAVPDRDRAACVIQRLGLIAYGDYELPPIPDTTPESSQADADQADN